MQLRFQTIKLEIQVQLQAREIEAIPPRWGAEEDIEVSVVYIAPGSSKISHKNCNNEEPCTNNTLKLYSTKITNNNAKIQEISKRANADFLYKLISSK